MSNIFIPWDINKKLSHKDCKDFVPMNDGTLVGDPKYCNKSFTCRQIGMKSDYIRYSGPGVCLNKDYVEVPCYYNNHFDYLCTGIFVTEENKKEDIEVN